MALQIPKDFRRVIVAATTCSLAIYLVVPHLIFPQIIERKSYKEFGTIMRQQAGPDAILVSQGVRQGLCFYAKRRVALFGGEGELEFGSRIGDQAAWFFDENRFQELWRGPKPVFAVIDHETLVNLSKVAQQPPRVLGKNVKRVLVTNR